MRGGRERDREEKRGRGSWGKEEEVVEGGWERKGRERQEGAGEGVGKVKTGAEHQRARREQERGWG